MFSIIIPTFNNLELLKLCLKSIKKNSSYNHEIIIHVNEGIDGTFEYVKNNNYTFSYSKKNEGVCVAFNQAVKKSTKKYILLGHDDMYFCPSWDNVFYDEIKKHPFPRSIESVKSLAILRGAQINVKYAEAFKLLKKIEE